jgi:glycosyltransferase involved in cell wall biosynthesis
MNIAVAVRCYNEEKNVTRFLRGYDFCDSIVISDGGSTDYSVDIIKYHQKYNPKIHLLNFDGRETVNGVTWNPDAPHMNFVLDYAKSLEPTFLIFDDMDCVPTKSLREAARDMFQEVYELQDYQINAFRLYMWGDKQYFPYLNRDFDDNYTSLWAWQPSKLDIHADESIRHGTLVGLTEENLFKLKIPYSLLHKSYGPETIDAKLERYNALGLTMYHPLQTNGELRDLPEWAVE